MIAEWLADQVAADEKRAHTDRARREVAFKRLVLSIHRKWAQISASCVGCGFDIHGRPATPNIGDCPELKGMANLVYPDRDGYQKEWQL